MQEPVSFWSGDRKSLTWDQVDLVRRIVTVEHGKTKNGDALGVPLNDSVFRSCAGGRGSAHRANMCSPTRATLWPRWIRRRDAERSSGPGSPTSNGTICGTPGPAGSGRMTCPPECCRNWEAGNRCRWCAAMRTCRSSICSLMPTGWLLRSHRRVTETRQIRLARKVTKVVTMGAVHGSGWWPD